MQNITAHDAGVTSNLIEIVRIGIMNKGSNCMICEQYKKVVLRAVGD